MLKHPMTDRVKPSFVIFDVWALLTLSAQMSSLIRHSDTVQVCHIVLCDTRDTSILIVDTYVTIPISPKSRYTPVYRSSEKYRETAQVSRVSTIPRVS